MNTNPAGQVFGAYRIATGFPMFGGLQPLGLPMAIRPGVGVDPAGFLASVGLLASGWIQLPYAQKVSLVSRSGLVPAGLITSFIARVDAFAAQPIYPVALPFYANPYDYASPYGFSGFGFGNPFFVRSFGDRSNFSSSPHSNANPNPKAAGLAQIRPAGQAVAVGASVSGLLGIAVGAGVGYYAAKKNWF